MRRDRLIPEKQHPNCLPCVLSSEATIRKVDHMPTRVVTASDVPDAAEILGELYQALSLLNDYEIVPTVQTFLILQRFDERWHANVPAHVRYAEAWLDIAEREQVPPSSVNQFGLHVCSHHQLVAAIAGHLSGTIIINVDISGCEDHVTVGGNGKAYAQSILPVPIPEQPFKEAWKKPQTRDQLFEVARQFDPFVIEPLQQMLTLESAAVRQVAAQPGPAFSGTKYEHLYAWLVTTKHFDQTVTTPEMQNAVAEYKREFENQTIGSGINRRPKHPMPTCPRSARKNFINALRKQSDAA